MNYTDKEPCKISRLYRHRTQQVHQAFLHEIAELGEVCKSPPWSQHFDPTLPPITTWKIQPNEVWCLPKGPCDDEALLPFLELHHAVPLHFQHHVPDRWVNNCASLAEMNVLLQNSCGSLYGPMSSKLASLTSVSFEDNQNELQDNIISNCSAAFALKWFIVSLRKFYISVTTKMLAKDPFRDPVVCGLSLLNPRNRGDLPPSLITDIARRFPNLVAEEDFTNLKEVFLSFWITPVSEFPSCNYVRTNELWGSILHLSNRIPKSKGFPLWIKWYLL